MCTDTVISDVDLIDPYLRSKVRFLPQNTIAPFV